MSPSLTPWRVTTGARVFAMALIVGTVLGEESATEAAPLLLALVVIGAVSTALEWNAPAESRPWIPVGEAFLVAVLLASAPMQPSLLIYLAVPPIVAGVRHGWVTTVNAGFVTGVTTLVTLALVPGPASCANASSSRLRGWPSAWASACWPVGSRARCAIRGPTGAVCHRQSTRLSAPRISQPRHCWLDSVQLAGELETALRGRRVPAVPPSSSTAGAPSPTYFRPTATTCRHQGRRSRLAIPTSRPSGCTEVRASGLGRPGARYRLVRRAEDPCPVVADEFVLRLDTAVLFDDVRLMATAEERNRIAREMHDGVAQEIVALGYIVDEIEAVSDQPETQHLAASLREEISRVVTELRFSIFDLRHEIAEHRLSGALAEYVREVSHGTDLRVHLLLDESGPALPSRAEMELLRVAQEAIGNVRRHAHASNLWVTLVSDGSRVRLEMEDDGVGNAAPKDRHWGLQTMRERAATIGADLRISSRRDGGTVVCLQTRQSPPPKGTAHMSTTVLLVDDHELIRQGLARAFERDQDMTVIGQAGTVAEARQAYADLLPDVVVTDLQLPDGHGLDIVRSVREVSDTTGVVVLTMHAGDDQIFAAMEAGASGFVGKESRAAEVISAAKHAAVARARSSARD